jgi:outer membrane PBP1 activator LpoA protein
MDMSARTMARPGAFGNRPLARLRHAVLGFVATLAACATPAPKTPEVAAEVAPPLPPPVVQPAEAPTNKVALLLPMTGGNARVGQSIANAANMALLDVGSSNIKLTVYDTAAGGAAAAAQRAIAAGNKLFLGPLLAGDVTAVHGAARAAGIPVVTYSNDASVAGDGVYVLGFQPDQSIDRVIRFARSRGIERFGALVPAGTYGQRASAAMLRAVRDSGGKVTAIETYQRSRAKLAAAVRRLTDYEARVARASQGGVVRADGTVAPVQERLGPVSFQALLIADTGAIASSFLAPLQQFGAGPGQIRYLGPELWNAEPGIRAATGLHGAWFASVPDARFNQLATRYRARFGGAPSRLASLGYDSVLLVNAIGGDWSIGAPFPERRLRDPDGFAGVDGIFRFGASGVADRGLEVQQVGPGGTTVVSAAPRTFARSKVAAIN